MKYKIFSDLHFFAPHELKVATDYSSNCVYLGDIFDLRNTAKKDIEIALRAQKMHNLSCESNKLINVRGNHDLDNSVPVYTLRKDILWTHGHHVCWDTVKIAEWDRYEPEGIGKLKTLYLLAKHALPKGIWKPAEDDLERIITLIKLYMPRTIVMGHTHTAKLVSYEKFGITIINVPRGVTEIEL